MTTEAEKDSENHLLEEKKQLAEDTAIRICEERNLPKPYVNFEGCDSEDENQLAHYHPEYNCICISKRQLSLLSFDEIKEVMAHEVTHILVLDHGDRFNQEEAISKIYGWTPPPGVIVIRSDEPALPKSVIEKIENFLEKLQKEAEEKRKEEEWKKYPLMPNREIENHFITSETSEEVSKLNSNHEQLNEGINGDEPEDYMKTSEKESFSVLSTQEVVDNAKRVQDGLDWSRQELLKTELDRKVDGTYDPYEERDMIRETSKTVRIRKFFCKIGIHKWSRKTYVDWGSTSNVKNWKRHCKICGKTQTWVRPKE